MFSFSNILTDVKAALVRSEQAVQGIVADIVNGAEVALSDLQGAGNWIAAHQTEIEAGVTGAVALATGVGVPISPVILGEVNAAAQALNVFAAAHNAGQSTPSSVVQGYVAYKQATGAISQATAASIQAKASAALSAVATAANAVAGSPVVGSQVQGLAASVASAASPAVPPAAS